MTEKINIAEILKNCEKGMELDCILFKDTPAFFHGVITETNYPIEIKVEYPSKELETFFLNKYGAIYDRPTAKCVIFPKGKTTWEGFQRPFMDGDILISGLNSCEGNPFIFKQLNSFGNAECYCAINCYGKLIFNSDNWTFIKGCRFATEEEKAKLFDAIKSHGYNWNPDTKTLERLVEPSEGTLVQIDFTRELRIADEVEVILGDYEFVLKDGKTYFVKKNKYPKTYEECCNILGVEDRENGYCGYEYELLGEFQQLLICRDAYWKIAGEQMGLGKPWKPDFTNNDEERYGIYTLANKVERDFCGVGDVNMILSFPTEEMRDKFYENFKELIEFCKELL